MWIRTAGGVLINLDGVDKVRMGKGGIVDGVATYAVRTQPRSDHAMPDRLATYPSKAKAQAAMDRLEKWLDEDGHLPDAVSGVHFQHQVFSFRTLSEDDEF